MEFTKITSNGGLNLSLVRTSNILDIKSNDLFMYTRSAISNKILSIIRIPKFFSIVPEKYKNNLEDPKITKYKTIKQEYNKNVFISDSSQIKLASSLFRDIVFSGLSSIVNSKGNIVFRLYNAGSIFHIDILRLCCDIYENVHVKFENQMFIDCLIVKCSDRRNTEDVYRKTALIKESLYQRLYLEQDNIFESSIQSLFNKYNDMFLTNWDNFLRDISK